MNEPLQAQVKKATRVSQTDQPLAASLLSRSFGERDGEMWLFNCYIPEWQAGSHVAQFEPRRIASGKGIVTPLPDLIREQRQVYRGLAGPG